MSAKVRSANLFQLRICLKVGYIFPGIYSVGKAAERLPALAYLSYRPPGAEKTVAWVGKGIVFDTGGLCIKTKVSSSVVFSSSIFLRKKVQVHVLWSPQSLLFCRHLAKT